jgi:integrase
MKPYPYLNCRKGIYQFRRIVPQKLRPILGQCEVVLSLATKDQKIARKAALEMGDLLDDLFAKIRSGAKLLSVADVELVSHHINKTKTEALMIEALEEFKNRQKEDEEWEAFHARTFRQEIKDDLRISSLDSAKPFVEELLVGREVSVPPDSAIYKQLCRAALKALDEFYKNAEIIVRGQFEHPRLIFDEQDTQIIEPLIVEGVEILKGDVTFKEAIDKYLTDNSSNWRTKQTENVKALLTYFLDYLSEDDGLTSEERTLGSVRGPMARAYKEHLQSAPSNSKKKYPGLSPRQSVEAAKSDGTPVLASETQNNYLQRLSTLYTFASTELDYEGKNPFKGRSNTKVRKGTNRDKRHSFSHQQLLDLFSSPIYTGCKSLPSCHRTGTLIPNRSHKYWTPLIGLFTGMRMQEILQLYVEDIYQQDDIWLLDLNDKHKDQTIKYSSHRKVPIHL